MSVEIRVPSLGESIVDAVIANWLKHVGEPVQQGDGLVELETDKVNVEVSAEQSGILQQIIKKEGDVVAVGEVLGIIDEHGRVPLADTLAPAVSGNISSALSSSQTTTDGQRPPSPLARKIAAEHNVDLAQVKGSSQYGRVTKDDVINYLEQSTQQPSPATVVASPPQAVSSVSTNNATRDIPTPAAISLPTLQGRDERIRLSRRRQTIAQRLVEAQHTAAMLTTFNEIDMSAVIEIRSRHKDTFRERYNISLGFMSFFTRAVVGALKTFPRLNAEIQGNEMVLKHYYDIGIAVGVEDGLVVPVVREADRKSFAEIEHEIAELAKRARENKLSLAELQGGTFTITNGGIFGSLMSTPILNAPQVGILGMHKIEQRPVAINGQVVIRPMMYVALSYDHRLVDGREAVQFLVKVKELVEDPGALLLEG